MPNNVIEFTIKGNDKFSKVFGKLPSIIGKVAAATTAATAAVFALAKQTAKAEDRAAKFAKRLGQSVESLTAIEFAGNRAGLSMQTVDMALQRLERRSAEAAEGLGEARGAIAELGIDAREFTNLGIEEKMQVLASKLEGVSDSATRTRIAFKLFDSEGVAMLQMLGDGSEAFSKVTNEARKFGAVISKQAAANAEKFEDSFTNMTTSIGGTLRGIGDEFIPIFTTVMDKIAGFIADNRDNVVNFVKSTIKGLATIWVYGERVFEGLGKTVEQFTSFSGIKDFYINYYNAFKRIFDSALLIFQAIGNFIITTFKLTFDEVGAIARWGWENIKSIFSDESGPSLGELLFKRLPEATAKAREQLSVDTQKMVETTSTQFKLVGDAVASIYNISLDGIDERVNELLNSIQTFGEVADNISTPVVENTQSIIEQVGELWDNFLLQQKDSSALIAETIFNTMQSGIDGISNAVATVAVEGGKLMDLVKAVAKSALKEVIAVLIKMGIQRVATAAISKSAVTTEAMTEASKAVGLSFANTLATMSAAPFPINLTAPLVAAAHAAQAAAGFTAGAATGKAIGATVAAHGGMDYVPKESTYFLDRGERVLSPKQNTDLTEFLSSGNAGGSVTIDNLQIDILPNATNADALLSMSKADMREVVSDAIIPALDALYRSGIKPLGA